MQQPAKKPHFFQWQSLTVASALLLCPLKTVPWKSPLQTLPLNPRHTHWCMLTSCWPCPGTEGTSCGNPFPTTWICKGPFPRFRPETELITPGLVCRITKRNCFPYNPRVISPHNNELPAKTTLGFGESTCSHLPCISGVNTQI